MREFNSPQLYELATTGNIKCWQIKVIESEAYSEIVTTFGVLGGKLQESRDKVLSGKNIGKANETTPYEQAVLEARSKFEGKKKKGYVENLEGARKGEVDSVIAGGIEPMLAHSYSKSYEKINFPAYAQPKLDGIRCIAIKRGEDVTLWTRTRKLISSCEHIIKQIREDFKGKDVVLDGELYNHKLKSNFEKIVKAVKREEATADSLEIEYHIYDIVEEDVFEVRKDLIGEVNHPLVKVSTESVVDQGEMVEKFTTYLELGYEGLMIRNRDGLYENKRSYNLQKVKEFEDAEFEIVGVKEGRGKLQGKVGTFTCKTKDGNIFDVKMMGSLDEYSSYLSDSRLWEGRELTVKFQGLTEKSSVPRFPVGVRIRVAE